MSTLTVVVKETHPCVDCGSPIAATGKRGRPALRCKICKRRRETDARRASDAQRVRTWSPDNRKNSANCAGCGKLIWGGTSSRPAGERRCRTCGRGRPFDATFVTKAVAPGRGGGPWRRLRELVLSEESNCLRCALPVDKALSGTAPGAPTVDHIVPLADGGAPLDRANVGLSHFACNSRAGSWKGDRSPAEYAAALQESYLREALNAFVGRLGYDEAMRILRAA